MHPYLKSIFVTLTIVAMPIKAMHRIIKQRTHATKPLNHIDRQLIIRHAKKVGALSLIEQVKTCKPATYVSDSSKDIAILVPGTTTFFKTSFKHPMAPRSAFENDQLAQDIFAHIEAIEKKSGYRPETIKGLNGAFYCATNKLSLNTRYWHKLSDEGRPSVTCTTFLELAHRYELEDLLNHYIPKDTI